MMIREKGQNPATTVYCGATIYLWLALVIYTHQTFNA